MSDLVSIIIPVYNTSGKYLSRCLKSITSQTYSNIEILVIDDGSGESYLPIYNEACSVDSRISLHHQANAGPSAARNYGMRMCNGDSIMFVDADDELACSDCIETAVDVMNKEDVDIVYGRVKRVYAGAVDECSFGLGDDPVFVSRDKAYLEKMQDYFFSFAQPADFAVPKKLSKGPISRLIKAEIIAEVTFDESLDYGEDVIFNAEAVRQAKAIALVDQVWYIYYQYESSLLHSARNLDWYTEHCNHVRHHIADDSQMNMYRSHCLQCATYILTVGLIHQKAMSLADVKELCRNELVREIASDYDDSRYVLPAWLKLMVRLIKSNAPTALYIILNIYRHLFRLEEKEMIARE